MTRFKRILCPIDFSPTSRHALAVAADLAKSAGGALAIVHIWQPPVYGTPDAPVASSVIQSLVDEADASLADWAAGVKANGVEHVTSQIVTGVPWHEIVGLAASADLVVMGTHGRTGLKHVLIGSVAEKVVRHAPCAVLVVR